ncbi:GNAT family N-acetyltransferase [Azotobacter vinelandii]
MNRDKVKKCSSSGERLLSHQLFFCVDEASRGSGVGAALESYATELAIARGCDRMEVHCHSRRTDAHRFFYHRQGYEESPKYLIKSLTS